MENKKVTIELTESDLKFLIYALGKAELWHIHYKPEEAIGATPKEFREWQRRKIDKCFMLGCELETEMQKKNTNKS